MKSFTLFNRTLLSTFIISIIAPLLILVPQASAATLTWDGEGADNNWSTAANWSGDTLPVNGDTIVFDKSLLSGSGELLTNDLTLNLAGVSSIGTSDYSYTIQGNDLTVSGALGSGTGGDFTLALNVILGANTTATGSGNIAIGSGGGSLDLSTYSLTLNMPNGHIYSEGTLAGSGDLNVSDGWFHTTSTVGTYSGDITLSGGYFTLFDGAISDTSSITVTDGVLKLDSSTQGIDYGMPFTLGTSTPSTSMLQTLGGLNEYAITISGGMTLTSDVKFVLAKDITITDPYVDGGFDLTVGSGSTGVVRLPGNVVIQKEPTSTTIEAGDKSSAAVSVFDKDTVIVKGERGSAYIYDGGTLKGTGTFTGSVNVASGGTLAPGLSPGCLTMAGLTIAGNYDVELAGTTVCSEYDQSVVNGAVNITGATLNVALLSDFTPALNDAFIIVNNDGSDAISGTFNGLADGATFDVAGVTFQINYNAGDGNDIVLLATEIPAAPDTGLEMLTGSPLVTAISALAAFSVILGLNYQTKRSRK